MNQRASLIFEVQQLQKTLGGRKVLNIKRLQFHRGIIYGLIGTPGSGKSTFLNLLAGVDKPSSGTLLFDNNPFQTTMLGRVKPSSEIYYASPASLPVKKTVESLVRKEYPSKIEEILKRYFQKSGLSRVWTQKIERISVGEKAFVASVLAVESDPRVLILDDYGVYFDQVLEEKFRNRFRKMNKDLGTTLILASSSDHYLKQFASVMIYLDNGHIARIRSGVKRKDGRSGSPDRSRRDRNKREGRPRHGRRRRRES